MIGNGKKGLLFAIFLNLERNDLRNREIQIKNGTDFVVHISLIPNIREFKDINPRISVLTIKSQFLDITFINVQASSVDEPQEEKDDSMIAYIQH